MRQGKLDRDEIFFEFARSFLLIRSGASRAVIPCRQAGKTMSSYSSPPILPMQCWWFVLLVVKLLQAYHHIFVFNPLSSIFKKPVTLS
jgi:hypothetical protein